MRIGVGIGFLILSTGVLAQSDTPCAGAGAPAIPVNTSCVNSVVQITGSASYQSDPANFGPVSCGFSGQDVWYSFVAPASGSVDILTAAGSITDGVMALYDSDCVTYTELACDDDSGPGLMPQISMGGLNAGQTYYLRFWQWFGGFGNFNVCVVEATAGASNQNCSGATGVCSNSSFSGNSNGAGIQELDITNSGCLFIEHQSSWYLFQAQTTGTLTFNISPQNGTDDYDFAIWGPGAACPPTTAPIRCSYAAGGGDTGLLDGSGDNTEDAFGDRWVEDMTIIAGQTYVMIIDNWSSTTSPFDLTWGGTASLDCTVLPVEYAYIRAKHKGRMNNLEWATASEIDNDYFVVQRSVDGLAFENIGQVDGAGYSNHSVNYSFDDRNHPAGLNYYRLIQVDHNGAQYTSSVVSVDNNINMVDKPVITLNSMGQEVDENYKGVRFMIFSDGSKTIVSD